MKIVDHAVLNKTRAEEHDADVWGRFYIPPYFQQLNLKSATKSVYIIGKRGCGKTMLLKYMDYHTAFSPKRIQIPPEELRHVGIYWRVDTQFCNSLKARGIDEENWKSIFDNYFAVVVSIEILRAVRIIADSAYEDFGPADFAKLSFSSMPDFHADFPTSADELERYLEGRRRAFSTWVSNMGSMQQPLLPPGRTFIEALIGDLRAVPKVSELSIYVYVDEVENLVAYQRRVLNSYLKHSQKPFIVSFTSKELSDESGTTGSESVNATHDFRLISLDSMLNESDRNVFFAEVYLANLDLARGAKEGQFISAVLSPDGLPLRQTSRYRDDTLRVIRARFPSRPVKEVAREAVTEPRIARILSERIEKALDKRKASVKVNEFMAYTDVPDALVIVPALLNRVSRTPADVLEELAAYRKDGTGAFGSGWVHNNLFGALLELYRPYQSICPIYSGFDTFCTMASNNLRHFLILAYKALEVAELLDEEGDAFTVETQATAAYEAAGKLVDEIRTFGDHGEQLRMFVLRIGGLFRALQSQPPMSEPEQNQFTINSGSRALTLAEVKLIREAMKYAIIVEQLETKTKSAVGWDVVDYQLNPIYAPYFQISYRRKRKIELSVEDFGVLVLGTEDDYRTLCGKMVKEDPALPITPQMRLWS